MCACRPDRSRGAAIRRAASFHQLADEAALRVPENQSGPGFFLNRKQIEFLPSRGDRAGLASSSLCK